MKKKKIIILSIVIIGLLLIVTGVTYSILSFKVEGNEINIVQAGILKIDINENEPITLLEAYPISTDRGMEGEPYTFTVSNTGDIDAIYRIYLDDVELDPGIERLSDSSIRYSLMKDGKFQTDTVADLLSSREDRIIDNGAIYPGETFNYELRMWIDEDVGNEEQGKAFKGKIRIEGEQLINDTCFTVNNNTITGYSNTCSKDVIIPSKINGVTITTIAQSAFANKNLTSVTLPSTLTTINREGFANNSLAHLEIPSSVTSILWGAFNNNQLPDDEAFIYARESDGSEDKTTIVSYGGAKRENVVIPVGVTTIENGAFDDADLISVTFPNTLTSIGSQAFRSNNLISLEIPSSVTYIAASAFNSNQLPDDEAFIYARRSDGSVDYTTLISYGGAKRANVIIPEGIETIRTAFVFTAVESVVFPSTLKQIFNDFASCNLTTLEFPPSLVYIEPGSFRGNQLPDEDAFIYARNPDGTVDDSTLISYGGAKRDNIVIPDNVKTISSRTFYNLGIKQITIPLNVETIEEDAFLQDTYSRTLNKIINKTGRSFDWGLIINGTSGYNFVTGTVYNQYGNVEIVSN